MFAATAGQGVSVAGYVGRYYDSAPDDVLLGKHTAFADQNIVSLILSKDIWRSQSYPLTIELEGVGSYQFGKQSLWEFGIVPVFRWDGFPWNDVVKTSFRFGPIGLSYTSSVSSFERTEKGASRWLNFLVAEVSFALPDDDNDEVFVRLHHRCSIFGLMNNYDTNGEDFVGVGLRHSF